MPDRPTARAAERAPRPFSPSAPGCAFSVHVRAGQFQSKFRRGHGPTIHRRCGEQASCRGGHPWCLVHSLRHTFVTHSLKQGTNRKVLEALGLSPWALDVYEDVVRTEMDRPLRENAL